MSITLKRKLKIFFCYAREDLLVASELYSKLKEIEWIEPWMDKKNILIGQDFDLEIDKAVRNTDIVLFFMSKNSTRDGYIQRELRYILDMAEQKSEGTIFILPLRIDNENTVPRRLNWIHYCDFFPVEQRSEAYSQLLDSLMYKAKEIGTDTTQIDRLSENTQNDSSETSSIKIENKEIKNNLLFQFKTPYSRWATCNNPGLLLYAVDISRSMEELLLGKRKIDFVLDLMRMTFSDVIRYSSENNNILPTYRIGMLTYAEDVKNVYLDYGEQLVDLDKFPGPPINLDTVDESTDTAKVFGDVLNLLKGILPGMQQSPPPIVVHITDGQFTGNDPEPLAHQIMKETGTSNGETLLLNVLLSEDVLTNSLNDLKQWKGIKKQSDVSTKYAKKLMRMSSYMPDTYVGKLREMGYSIVNGTKLLFPIEAIEVASKIYSVPNIRFER